MAWENRDTHSRSRPSSQRNELYQYRRLHNSPRPSPLSLVRWGPKLPPPTTNLAVNPRSYHIVHRATIKAYEAWRFSVIEYAQFPPSPPSATPVSSSRLPHRPTLYTINLAMKMDIKSEASVESSGKKSCSSCKASRKRPLSNNLAQESSASPVIILRLRITCQACDASFEQLTLRKTRAYWTKKKLQNWAESTSSFTHEPFGLAKRYIQLKGLKPLKTSGWRISCLDSSYFSLAFLWMIVTGKVEDMYAYSDFGKLHSFDHRPLRFSVTEAGSSILVSLIVLVENDIYFHDFDDKSEL
ncbi:hypothetical protein NA56DRAFT_702089 [Hyaloscypha hepaticicola]|uniref:Uncharacterized protein n=1 Tax=Hyaloscypha hepaticicola TaxID=2082293 RepID=A0A2J6Q9S0_9HELO|nr:hypothetical protein NA56DRAFT_702089 [Hyaloscypha hepaticicola]